MPTFAPTEATLVAITGLSSNTYVRLNGTGLVYTINASVDVTLTGCGDCALFAIVRNPGSKFTIHNFSMKCDVVDLSSWPEYKSFDSMEIRSGSIVIQLVDDQIIKILNARPTEIKASNFRYGEYPVIDEGYTMAEKLALGLVGIVIVFGLYQMRGCCISYCQQIEAARRVEVLVVQSRERYDEAYKWLHRDISEKLESLSRSSSSTSSAVRSFSNEEKSIDLEIESRSSWLEETEEGVKRKPLINIDKDGGVEDVASQSSWLEGNSDEQQLPVVEHKQDTDNWDVVSRPSWLDEKSSVENGRVSSSNVSSRQSWLQDIQISRDEESEAPSELDSGDSDADDDSADSLPSSLKELFVNSENSSV